MAKIDEDKIIDKIKKDQSKFKETNVKYKQVKKKKDTDDAYEYEVHEYVCPDGSVGYQTVIYKGDMKKSIGYGKEKDMRTFDWISIFDEEDK